MDMKKTIILLAGFPGTGKSYLANQIKTQFREFEIISPDDVKEAFWDAYGFTDLDEKNHLIQASWIAYYHIVEQRFKEGIPVLSDYPFSEKQKEILHKLTEQFQYQVITIRLVGQLPVLYERQRQRDLDSSRHAGHIVKEYHKDRKLVTHESADNLLDYEEFKQRCTTRGYESFSLGETVELDVTDFNKVDYNALLRHIALLLKD